MVVRGAESASQAASWGSTSPCMAQSSRVAESRVVVAEATDVRTAARVVSGCPGRVAGGEPAGQHVVAERGQAGAATEEVHRLVGGRAAPAAGMSRPYVMGTAGSDTRIS